MSQPYNYYVGDGATAAFQFTQPLNDKATVVGWENGIPVSGTWDSGTGFFTFDTAPVSGADVHVVRQTAQDLMYTTFPNKSYISSDNLDKNNRQLIELAEEISWELAYRVPEAAANAAAAAASAAAAALSETAAATSETNAATSETNSAASAVASAASAVASAAAAASMIWQDVTFASSGPITVATADKGTLYVIDCTAGDVTVNLPSIAAEAMPFTVGFKKSDNSSNSIIVNGNGTDEIDGSAQVSLGIENGGATLVADEDPTPDAWTAMNFGAGVSNKIGDIFVDGVDYTSGSSTSVSLSGSPGSVNNVAVYFDGVRQHTDQYSLIANVMTFTSAIPSGVSAINAVQGSALSIGEPSDGSVGTAKIQAAAITMSHLSGVTKDEDDMASNSALHFATQQSVKAYVDSFAVLTTVLDIGDWNMNTTNAKAVAHGIADHTKIRSVSAVIIPDTGSIRYSFEGSQQNGTTGSARSIQFAGTNVTLSMAGTGDFFNSTAFQTTPFNRGYIVIQHVA